MNEELFHFPSNSQISMFMQKMKGGRRRRERRLPKGRIFVVMCVWVPTSWRQNILRFSQQQIKEETTNRQDAVVV